jgi:hypothetical protein
VERRRRWPMRFDLAEMRLNGRGQYLRRNSLWGGRESKTKRHHTLRNIHKMQTKEEKGGEE